MDDGSSGDGVARYRVRAVNTVGTSDPSNEEGVWVKDPSPYSKAEGSEADALEPIPEEFGLDQSVPNPGRGQVTIRVALPEASEVSLAIYDVRGREIARPMDGSASAGFHDVQFDTSELASGVYFYRIKAGDFTKTRRMTIVK